MFVSIGTDIPNVIWNTNCHVRYSCVGLNSALIHVSVGVFYDSSLKSEDK